MKPRYVGHSNPGHFSDYFLGIWARPVQARAHATPAALPRPALRLGTKRHHPAQQRVLSSYLAASLELNRSVTFRRLLSGGLLGLLALIGTLLLAGTAQAYCQ
jgi:hypothetical protein